VGESEGEMCDQECSVGWGKGNKVCLMVWCDTYIHCVISGTSLESTSGVTGF
jgi:hypothetical protein